MYKYHYTLLFLLFFLLLVKTFSQGHYCYEDPNGTYDPLYGLTYSCDVNDYSCKVVRVYLHIIRKSNKTGGKTLNEVLNAYNEVRKFFDTYNSTKIQLLLENYKYIDDNNYYKPKEPEGQ